MSQFCKRDGSTFKANSADFTEFRVRALAEILLTNVNFHSKLVDSQLTTFLGKFAKKWQRTMARSYTCLCLDSLKTINCLDVLRKCVYD